MGGSTGSSVHGRHFSAELLECRRLLSATMVKDVYPGPVGSSPFDPAVLGNDVYFGVFAPDGPALCRTNGTADGTTIVRQFTQRAVFYLTVVGDTIFFAADDHTAGNELWESDGTGAGTSLVKDISPRSLDSNPRLLTRFGDRLLFAANQDTWGIWVSDGTDEGTIRLSDVGHPDTNSNMVVIGNDAYFAATDSIHGLGLWKTDGTPQGTSLVKGISGGTSASSLRELTNVGGTLYYFVNDGSGAAELWRSDGTTPGTSLVKRFNSVGSGLRYPTAYNGILFFSADDGAHGAELWKSDGTAAGTARRRRFSGGVRLSTCIFGGLRW